VKHVLGRGRRVEQVVAGHRRAVAELRAQVTAEQRPGLLLVEHVRLPVMGHVRRRDLDHAALQRRTTDLEHLAVGERPRRPVAQVVERHRASQRPVRDRRVRRRGEELVHRPAFVRLDVRERDPAQPGDRQHLLDRLPDEREQLAHAGVVQQGLLRVHQELVEGEAARRNVGHVGGDAVDPVGDLVHPCFHHVLLDDR
jgi:hypothetical protein